VRVAILIVVMVVTLVVACGESMQNWMAMDCSAAPTVQTATITWQRTDDPAAVCRSLGVETMARNGACISCTGPFSGQMFCTLHTVDPATIGDMFLGHETKHAFGCTHG
jgi:hypothetical protein